MILLTEALQYITAHPETFFAAWRMVLLLLWFRFIHKIEASNFLGEKKNQLLWKCSAMIALVLLDSLPWVLFFVFGTVFMMAVYVSLLSLKTLFAALRQEIDRPLDKHYPTYSVEPYSSLVCLLDRELVAVKDSFYLGK